MKTRETRGIELIKNTIIESIKKIYENNIKRAQTPEDYGMKFDTEGKFTGAVNSRPKHPVSRELENIACTGTTADFAGKEKMWSIINKNEPIVNSGPTVDNYYWLAVAYRNYCAWYIRGDDRKQYLEKAVHYFELAFQEARKTLPVHTDDDFEWLSQVVIAGELSRLLIDESSVRTLDKGLRYAQFVFNSMDGYDPSMFSLIRYYRYKEQHEQAVKIARELKRRINANPEWKGVKINYQIIISLRALRDECKKEGDYKTALKWSSQIMRFKKDCSETDKKRHQKLIELTNLNHVK